MEGARKVKGERDANSLLEQLLTPSEIAEKLHLNVQTLAKWRCTGKGPRFVKAGRMVFYPARFVEEWLQSKVCGGETAAPRSPAHAGLGLPLFGPTKTERPHRFGRLKTKREKAQERTEAEALKQIPKPDKG